jgi:ketosteroid isomerase-like protein
MSGVLGDMSMAMVWSFRDGKEVRMDLYSDPHEALKAVGLEE